MAFYTTLRTKRDMALVVASLDFGTTFSGWAYQTMHDFKTNPNNVFAKVWYSAEPISSKSKFYANSLKSNEFRFE